MTTITIPKQLTKMGDLVIVPRKEYEKLLKNTVNISATTLTTTEKRAVARARREIKRGEFLTLKELGNELGITHSQKR